MSKSSAAALVLAFGVLALWLERHKQELPATSQRARLRFRLLEDLPGLGLRSGRSYGIDPHALIYLGDPVAVRDASGRVLLAEYQDELMPSVIGLVTP